MYTIYKVTNIINNKSYVGFTIKNPPQKRWMEHISHMKRGCQYHLHRAIRKYGPDKFIFEVLEEGEDPEIGKSQRESYWISFVHPEYNKTNGGEGCLGYKHTEETLKRLSVPKTDQHREKIRQSLQGKVYSDTRRRNMAENCPKNSLGKKWYHDPNTKKETYVIEGTQPSAIIEGRSKG
jgi:group I intron endonuclease